MIDTMDRQSAVARMTEIHERLEELSTKHRMSKAETQEMTEIGAEFDDLRTHVDALDRRDAIAGAVRGGSSDLRVETPIDPYAGRDAAADRMVAGQRDSALRQLERSVTAGLPARSAEVVEHLVNTGPEVERSWVSRWVTDTGSDHYRSAFAKLLLHGESRAALEWNQAERAAYDRVARLASEQRAMSLTDSSGGFLVPFELDPTINIVNAGSINPLLEISRLVHSVTDVWHGVNSAGVVSEWLAEASEASDASPALAEPEVPNYKASTFVPFSVELQGDAISLLDQLGRLMSDGMTQLLNTAFTTGSGTGLPTGIVTALTGGSSVVNTGTGGTLTAADIYAVQSSLGPRFQANAKWTFNLAVLNALRQMETTNGALKFPSLQSDPPTLLGRPAYELSNLNGTVAAGQPLGVYGDFQNYVISQRVGSSVELIPHLFGANRRPTGQRGVWMWARYGADSINDAAFRLLQA
jgi:HK97 family phage major capsid protein